MKYQLKSLVYILPLVLLFACGKPIAKFSYSGETLTAPAKVSFKNDSEKAENYEWDFGDGGSSTEVSPNHQYNASGAYTVTLMAKKGEKVTRSTKVITIDAPEQCLVELVTEFGNMMILLYDATPQHRDNFLKLAEEGFYDDLLFHRVINGFMIQGGDPQSKNAEPNKQLGSGGPGYMVTAEFVDTLIHLKGSLAAARMPDQVNPEKKSSGSQFYIVQGKPISERDLNLIEARKDIRYTKAQRDAYMNLGGTPFLDREYTVFGKVISGMEVIDKIANVATKRGDRPVKDVSMKIRVIK